MQMKSPAVVWNRECARQFTAKMRCCPVIPFVGLNCIFIRITCKRHATPGCNSSCRKPTRSTKQVVHFKAFTVHCFHSVRQRHKHLIERQLLHDTTNLCPSSTLHSPSLIALTPCDDAHGAPQQAQPLAGGAAPHLHWWQAAAQDRMCSAFQ